MKAAEWCEVASSAVGFALAAAISGPLSWGDLLGIGATALVIAGVVHLWTSRKGARP